MSTKHIIISGRVQGVGFRRYVFLMAQKYGIKGWVRNIHNGDVEILMDTQTQLNSAANAIANPMNEELFIKALQKGPPASEVTKVHVTELAKEEPFTDFNVRENGSRAYAE